MRKRFTTKVVVFVSFLLLLFSFLVTISFQYFYYQNFIDHTRESLLRDASNISINITDSIITSGVRDDLKEIIENDQTTGVDLTLYERLISADFYLVDPDYNMYENGNNTVVAGTIDPAFTHAADEAFLGKHYYTTKQAESGETEVLGAVPIKGKKDEIIGVIIVKTMIPAWYHSSNNTVKFILISLSASFVIVVLIAMLSSRVLTKPILELNESTLELVKEKYNVRNHVKREDEIGQLASSLNTLAAKMEADQKILQNEEASKRRFLSQISHELKTPVTIMRGSLELLNDGIVQDETKKQEYYTQMLAQSDHLQKRINEILDLTKLQTPEFEMKMGKYSFSDILSDALMSIRPLARKKNIEIHCDPFEGEDVLICDEGRIRQLLIILLDNAVKYSHENSRIDVRYDNTYVEIEDHGIGISKEALAKIGQPYYRAEPEIEGSGLGLYIAREICTRHHFAFSIQSEEGKGTRVKIEFSEKGTH